MDVVDDVAGRVAEVARGQHGLLTLAQAVDVGLRPSTLRRWVLRGRLERLHPGVFRVAGTPVTWEQAVLAAVLAAGDDALASHRAAAWLWGLVDERPGPELTVSATRRPRVRGAVVHRVADLPLAARSTRAGLPTTDPLRTMVDLGAVAPRRVVDEALERGLAARLFTVAAVDAARARLARRGRDGSGVLRTVLDRRLLGSTPPDSVLEPRMARLLASHGLPPAAFQHEVRDGARLVARVDFAYPATRLAVEVDGAAAHGSPAALHHDLERQNALVLLGWTVLRFTWTDVVRRPGHVANEVALVLRTSTTST